MLNSENAILERKNYRILSSSTVRLTSLFEVTWTFGVMDFTPKVEGGHFG